jgi:hypothetical protein
LSTKEDVTRGREKTITAFSVSDSRTQMIVGTGYKANAFYYCNFMVTRKQKKKKGKHKGKPQAGTVSNPIALSLRGSDV